jgi:transcriptional regulator with XRE-family HTH domain
MKVNAELIVRLRKERSWSQDELAIAAGLNLRTIQRVENDGAASLQSKKALAAALEIDTHDLDSEEVRMKPCPVCGSNDIYQYDECFPTRVLREERRCSQGWAAFFRRRKSARPCVRVAATCASSPRKKPGRS